MPYDTDYDFLVAELARSGLPISPQTIRACQADTRAEVQGHVKALAQAIHGHGDASRQSARSDIQARISQAQADGNADLSLALKGQL